MPDLDAGQNRGAGDIFDEIHFLREAAVVYPRGRTAPPLLLVRTASFISGDGDRINSIQLLAYRPREQRFEVAFRAITGQNNNQEMRYMGSGPLKGSVIIADSPYGPPFTYLVAVNRLTVGYRYKQVLRYRSATHYNDGNALAVIDSEMPNILRRLGLWHVGDPLRVPKTACPHPHLVKTELWCS